VLLKSLLHGKTKINKHSTSHNSPCPPLALRLPAPSLPLGSPACLGLGHRSVASSQQLLPLALTGTSKHQIPILLLLLPLLLLLGARCWCIAPLLLLLLLLLALGSTSKAGIQSSTPIIKLIILLLLLLLLLV
jgi:hypothetical protein